MPSRKLSTKADQLHKDAEASAKEALDAAKAAGAPDVDAKQQVYDKAAMAVADKTKEQEAALKPLSDAVASATQARDSAKAPSATLIAKQQVLDKAESDQKAKVAEQTAALKPLNDAATAADEALKASQTAKTNAEAALTASTKLRSERESAVQQAKSNPDTSAGGSGTTVSYPTGEYYASHSAAAVEIAKVVGEMQRTHLWQSFATDDCLRYLLQDRSKKPGDERWKDEQKKEILALCKEQIKRTTDWRFENLYLTFGCNKDGTKCHRRRGIFPWAPGAPGATVLPATPAAAPPPPPAAR